MDICALRYQQLAHLWQSHILQRNSNGLVLQLSSILKQSFDPQVVGEVIYMTTQLLFQAVRLHRHDNYATLHTVSCLLICVKIGGAEVDWRKHQPPPSSSVLCFYRRNYHLGFSSRGFPLYGWLYGLHGNHAHTCTLWFTRSIVDTINNNFTQ